MIGMEEGRFLFDASAYMLFEASGDSEGANDFGDAFEQESDAAAEDDAQSCNDGSFCDFTDRMNEVVDSGAEFDCCSVDYESDEEDGVVDQCCRKAATEPAKSKAFDGSNAVVSEREGDRLFWEACLAS